MLNNNLNSSLASISGNLVTPGSGYYGRYHKDGKIVTVKGYYYISVGQLGFHDNGVVLPENCRPKETYYAIGFDDLHYKNFPIKIQTDGKILPYALYSDGTVQNIMFDTTFSVS